MDAFHYHVRSEVRIVKRAVYIAIGMDERKDVLGINLSTYFKYPEPVRHLIYTTNAIEGFYRQLRKVTKSKTIFPSDESLLKMLYLATMDITKK